MGALRAAIGANAGLIKGKVVLDVGCGLGLLSLWAAAAGAAHVYAIDPSPAADTARRVVEAAGLASRITVIRGRAEDVALPVRSVDVILSDWVGRRLLLADSLAPAVVAARDRFLAPGGHILPNLASLHVQGVSTRSALAAEQRFWRDVQGLDLSAAALPLALKQPRLGTVARSEMVTDAAELLRLDLRTATAAELAGFKKPFRLTAARADRLYGLAAFFDLAFDPSPAPPGGAGAAAAGAARAAHRPLRPIHLLPADAAVLSARHPPGGR
jgi:protein arginine N-methyltransferase 1